MHIFKLNRNHAVIPGTHSTCRQSIGHGWQQHWEQEKGRRQLWEVDWPGWIIIPHWGRYQVSTQEISRSSEVHVLPGRAVQGV